MCNFKRFKKGVKERIVLDRSNGNGLLFWNTTRQLNAPERAAQVTGGQLFGVRLPIFNLKF